MSSIFPDKKVIEETTQKKNVEAQETEKQFSDWMTDYLHKLPQAQSEIYGRRYMKKFECKSAVQMFLLSYGWKTTQDWRN